MNAKITGINGKVCKRGVKMIKVKCVDNTGMENTIKLRNTYVLVKEMEKYYRIKLKQGTTGDYLKYRFKKIEDQ
jgi:hypothetical protein